MITSDETKKIKEIAEELLQKMTINVFNVDLKLSYAENEDKEFKISNPINIAEVGLESHLQSDSKENKGNKDNKEVVNLNITLQEPQILIGQDGQTLFELERILRIILNKKLQNNFYLQLDINDYKKKKIEYLKKMAQDLANEVSLNKEKKVLPPMSAYQRRAIHMELATRSDIITESQGQGADRCVVIAPAKIV